MKHRLIAVALLAALVLSLCACTVTSVTTTPDTSATQPSLQPPTDQPTQTQTDPPVPPSPTDEEYLAQLTEAVTASVPVRSESVVTRTSAGAPTLVSSFVYTASDDRTVYTRQRLGELTAGGGELVVTENGAFAGRAATPGEGIALSALSLSLSYFSDLSFEETDGTLTMSAAVNEEAVASVFGAAPEGGSAYALRIVSEDGCITEICLTYRVGSATLTVLSTFTC